MEKTATQWMLEPLRKYATFTGRARRKEFWWFVLLTWLISLSAAGVDHLLGLKIGVVGLACLLGMLLPQTAVTVRRLHDTNRSGWWLLLPLVPALPAMIFIIRSAAEKQIGQPSAVTIIGIVVSTIAYWAVAILLVFWFCRRGTIGENRFGPDPIPAT